MTSRGFFLHILEAERRGEHRVWFRNRDTQVVCHFDIKSRRLISFCGGIMPDTPAYRAEFLSEPWEFGYRDLYAVPCSESHTVVGRIAR